MQTTSNILLVKDTAPIKCKHVGSVRDIFISDGFHIMQHLSQASIQAALQGGALPEPSPQLLQVSGIGLVPHSHSRNSKISALIIYL